MKSTFPKWMPVLALTAMLPLAACGGADDDMEMDDGMTAEDGVPAPAPTTPDVAGPTMIMLTAKNESGVTGEATATHRADSATVEVSISGASADGNHPAHVHSGTCEQTGSVLAPLTPLNVTGGSGSSTSTVALSQVPEGEPAVIQVHNPSGQPIACGDMAGHGDMNGGATDM